VRILSVLPVLALLGAGCAKSSDVGRLEEEATGVATRYKPRLDDLSRRLDKLMARDKLIADTVTGHPLASRRLFDMRAMLEQLKNEVSTSPGAIVSASKLGPTDLIRLTDHMDEQLRDGVRRVNDEIDALDSWISIAETQPHPTTPPAPDAPKLN
jgi:hypothetical protein